MASNFFVNLLQGVRLQAPYIPPIRDYKDLCDGVCLAFLVANYCPNVVPWTLVRVNHLPSVEDSIHNILLVLNFSHKHLPYSVFHMTPEDISYMRGWVDGGLHSLQDDRTLIVCPISVAGPWEIIWLYCWRTCSTCSKYIRPIVSRCRAITSRFQVSSLVIGSH